MRSATSKGIAAILKYVSRFGRVVRLFLEISIRFKVSIPSTVY